MGRKLNKQKLKFWKPVSRLFKRRIWKPVIRRYGKAGAAGVIIIIFALLAAGGGAVRALLIGATSSQSTTVNLDKGLIGRWKMDNDFKDSSPYGNNCSRVGGAAVANTTDRKGKASGAWAFDGTNGYLNCGTNAVLRPTAGVTLSAWVKYTGTPDGLLKGIINYGNGGYWLSIDGTGNAYFTIYNSSGGNSYATTTSPLPVNEWHHLTATYGNTNDPNARLYLDGVLVSTTAFTGTIGQYANQLNIGANKPTQFGDRRFPGSIDEVRIYNRAINASEAKALYGEYDAVTEIGQGEKGLVGWWKFDGNPKDATPYANNGSLAASPTLAPDRKGLANSAYNFNGSYVSIPASSALNSTKFTYSAWIKPTAYVNGSSYGTILLTPNGPDLRFNSSGALILANRNNSATLVSTAAGIAPLNAWSHVAVTYSSVTNQAFIYVNGAVVGSNTPAAQTFVFDLFRIGANNAVSQPFTGSIDDVKMYNRALSSSEIANQVNSYNSQINLGGSNSGGVSLTKGLMAQWDFNGNAKDSTPNANDGTVGTGVTLTTDRKGRANSAYSFPSTAAGSIIYPDSPSLNAPVNDATVSAWIAPTAFTSVTASSIIMKRLTATPNYGYAMLYVNGSTSVRADWGGSNLSLSSGFNPPLGQWSQITYTYSSTASPRFKIYVNGSLAASGNAGGGANLPVSSILKIGGATSTGDNYYFNGKIDDIRIYNRALSAAEAAALYSYYH